MTTILFGPISWAKILLKHLWLSVSSIDFYQDVFNLYEGYGIKYILTISFLSSFLCSVVLLNNIIEVKNYFTDNIISSNVVNIDHIINQFPDLNYNGQSISLDEENIIYLTNINNNNVVAIDPENRLSHTERNKIPIILASNKIIFSLIRSGEEPQYTTTIDYGKIFGNSEQHINQPLLKSYLADVFKNAPEIFIYIFFPFIGFLIFVNALVEKGFIIVVIYLLANIFAVKASLKTCVRMVIFASGAFFLLQPITLLVFPVLNTFIWLIQIWSNMLMIIALLKMNNTKFQIRR